MSSIGLEKTPIDEELTKLPLPVLAKGSDYYLRESNFHHHFHPKITTELGYNENGNKLAPGSSERVEGVAVRQSRGQLLPKWIHSRYHEIYYGPQLPIDQRSKFTAVVLACAGVVPRQAISLYKKGESEIVELSDKQHDFIRRRIYHEGAASKPRYDKRDNIGVFVARYAIDNSLREVVSEEDVMQKVEEFLFPRDEQSRRSAGKFIIEHAVDASVSTLIDVHSAAARGGMINRPKRGLGEAVLRYFPDWPEKRFTNYLTPLENELNIIFN